MKASGLARIGRTVELRYMPQGDAVANIALAFSYGKKDADGNRQTQWVEAALYGKRAETLAPYLPKGGKVVAYLSDVHIESYEGKNGPGHKLVARVDDLELAGSKGDDAAPTQMQQTQAKPQATRTTPATASGGSGFDDMDDDITF